MNYLAKNIRHLRKKSSKTQEDIGSLVHKGQTTIGNWENGKSEPNIGELLVLSNFFDISVDLLLKVDLAGSHLLPADQKKKKTAPISNENTIRYNYNDWESLVKEYDEKILSEILREIKSLRQELNQPRNGWKSDPPADGKTGPKATTQSNQKAGTKKSSRPED
ncbi:MAG: helix-turn-helix transcriptional regulator [Puia sp.]|nr:helix-turn-helix transcriptional regulator [Puia sp.]